MPEAVVKQVDFNSSDVPSVLLEAGIVYFEGNQCYVDETALSRYLLRTESVISEDLAIFLRIIVQTISSTDNKYGL